MPGRDLAPGERQFPDLTPDLAPPAWVAVIGAVAVAVALGPSLRATRVDPINTLRE